MASLTSKHTFNRAKNMRTQGMSKARVVPDHGWYDMGMSGDGGSLTKTSTTTTTPSTTTPASGSQPGVLGAQGIAAVQRGLVGAGFTVGASGVDGVFGPCTANAIRAFAMRNGDAQALTLFGTALMQRARAETRTCVVSGGGGGGGSGSGGGGGSTPEDTSGGETPPAPPGGGLDIGGAISRVLEPLTNIIPLQRQASLTDPLFLGLIALGIVGSVVGYTVWKKMKTKKAAAPMTKNARARRRSRR